MGTFFKYKNKISFTHAFTSNAHILMYVPIDRFFVRFDISNLSCVVNDSSCIRVRQEIDWVEFGETFGHFLMDFLLN